MTDEEIHNIYLHMSGKAEGLVEATGKADFPVLFARAILEYEGMTKDVQNMASKFTYKEQLETKDKPVSCAECGADGGHALYCVACAEKFIAQTETKDKPVAWEQFYPDMGKPQIAFNTVKVEYVAPQRTWVGLTDEDKQKLATEQHDWESLYFAVQAKLKEKNT